MVRSSRLAAQKALELLQNLPDDNSGDEGEGNYDDCDQESEIEEQESYSQSDFEDDSFAHENDSIGKTIEEVIAHVCDQNIESTVSGIDRTSKNEIEWLVLNEGSETGFRNRVIFTGKPGLTTYAKTRINTQ